MKTKRKKKMKVKEEDNNDEVGIRYKKKRMCVHAAHV